MGQRTQATTEAWQKKAGLEPAADQETLCKLSDAAFELIKIIELEKSGIRDGDGYWHGGDVIGGTVSQMRGLLDQWQPPNNVVRLGNSFLCTPRDDDECPFF
jgi:hypothetical protein